MNETTQSNSQVVNLPPPPPPPMRPAHKSQVLKQIVLPLGIGTLIVLGLAVLVVLSSAQGTGVQRGAHVSLILMIIPVMLCGLAVLALVGGLIYLLARLSPIVLRYLRLVDFYILLAARYVRVWSDRIAQPVVNAHSMGAAISQIKRLVFGKYR